MEAEASYQGFIDLSASWIELTPPTEIEHIETALKRLSFLEEKINEHAKEYFNDLKNTLNSIELIQCLNPSDKAPLSKLITPAICILDRLKVNNNLDIETRGEVESSQRMLGIEFKGLGKELEQIRSLTSIAKELALLSNSDEHILTIDGDHIKLVDSKRALDQECVHKYLEDIIVFLKDNDITEHLSINELFQIKVASCYLMANYINAQKLKLDLTDAIFATLFQLNKSINEILASINSQDFEKVSNFREINTLNQFCAHLRNKFYFPDFWADPKHVSELKQYENCCFVLNELIQDETGCDINGLQFLEKNEEVGLAFYQIAKEGEPPVLVAFSFNKDDSFSHFNGLQDRTCKLHIGGLAHAPVVKRAESVWEVLKQMIVSHDFDNQEIQLITVGFGLDGAVAEIMSSMCLSQFPKMQTRCYAMGVPPFLDVNAAANIKGQENHYSINFRLYGDKS